MIRDMAGCGGCRTCEMACSFHHTKAFNPAVSSIRILEKKEGAGYRVMLVEEKGPGTPCDGCRGLKTPLCMEYCKAQGELESLIEELLANKERVE